MNKLYVKKDNGIFLGVCSGIADMLEEDVTLVRLLCLFLIINVESLFIAYICFGLIAPDKSDLTDLEELEKLIKLTELKTEEIKKATSKIKKAMSKENSNEINLKKDKQEDKQEEVKE